MRRSSSLVARAGRALGFRWAFPIGTLAVPFHPAFLPLVVATLVVWTATLTSRLVAGSANGVGAPVLVMAIIFAAVGMLMSVPVLGWIITFLGGPLVQALLAFEAALLLSVSVATGRDPWWLAVLPAAYVGTWAYQAVGGRILLLRLRASARRFEPIDVRGRTVVLDMHTERPRSADLLVHCGAGTVWTPLRRDGDGGQAHALVTPEQATEVSRAARGVLPADVGIETVDGHSILSWTGALPTADTVVVRRIRSADHRFLLGRGLWRLDVGDRSLLCGRAFLVLPVPLLTAFRFFSLTSRSEWTRGFARGSARAVGDRDATLRPLLLEVEDARAQSGPSSLAALDAARRRIAGRDAAIDRLRADALRARVDTWAERDTIHELERGGVHLLGQDAPEVLATWLKGARSGRHEGTPRVVARLVATLADEEIVRHGDRLVDAFNSRTLALRWQLTPDLDVTPLPRELYRFGDHAGFGLALDMPSLYVRLGDLLPPFRPMVAQLHGEMGLGDEIESALERWRPPRMDPDAPGTVRRP